MNGMAELLQYFPLRLAQSLPCTRRSHFPLEKEMRWCYTEYQMTDRKVACVCL